MKRSAFTACAMSRMEERELVMSDALHVPKHGFNDEESEEFSRPGLYEYKMECTTLNSDNRTIRVAVIPSTNEAKIVSAMRVDQPFRSAR